MIPSNSKLHSVGVLDFRVMSPMIFLSFVVFIDSLPLGRHPLIFPPSLAGLFQTAALRRGCGLLRPLDQLSPTEKTGGKKKRRKMALQNITKDLKMLHYINPRGKRSF